MIRNCPKCNREIEHKTKRAFLAAKRRNRPCRRCALSAEERAKRSERLKLNHPLKDRDINGCNNPFYGKKHTEESKKKIKNNRNNDYLYTEAHKKQAREQLAKVQNRRPIYDCWLDKYGREEADKRFNEFKRKQSEANSGDKNGMYGKPPPKGSGNGWSGWYKDWYFRSLHELSYVINVIESQGLHWISAERKDLGISYIKPNGKSATYFADFLIEGKCLVECKPHKLQDTILNILKSDAAKLFCQEKGWHYVCEAPKLLIYEEIYELYINNKIKFTDKTKDRMEKIICRKQK